MKNELRVTYRGRTTPWSMDLRQDEVNSVIAAWLLERWGSRGERSHFAVHVRNGRVMRGYTNP